MGEFRLPETMDIWLAENVFYLAAPLSRLGKLLAHFELYKTITNLPGAVVECGVFKGASLMRLASYRALCETTDSRLIVGFDAFGRFPNEGLSGAADRDFIEVFEANAGDGISIEGLEAALLAKNFTNVHLRAGHVGDTVPAYLKAFPALRIAFLHLDLDVYEPTRLCLELLADRVVPGGLIVFDDYGAVAGATRAAEEYVAVAGKRLEKLPLYSVPAFVRV